MCVRSLVRLIYARIVLLCGVCMCIGCENRVCMKSWWRSDLHRALLLSPHSEWMAWNQITLTISARVCVRACLFLAHQFRFIFLSFATLHLIIKNVLERLSERFVSIDSTKLQNHLISRCCVFVYHVLFPISVFPLHSFLLLNSFARASPAFRVCNDINTLHPINAKIVRQRLAKMNFVVCRLQLMLHSSF